jgi:hypothetical protein
MQRVYPSIAIAMVAAFAAAGASAHTPLPRSYGGRTSQGMPMSIKVAKNAHSVRVKVTDGVDCPTLTTGGYSGTQMFTAPLSASRRFAGGYTDTADLPDDPAIGAGDLTAQLQHHTHAKLGRKSAVGVWRTRLTLLDGTGKALAACDSGTVTFKLRAGGRAVFSSGRALSEPSFR